MTLRTIVTGAATITLLAAPALASDRDRALLAISQAQGNIQLASSAGAETWSADVQAQANMSLEHARRQLSKSNEHRAFYAAREADAYARLALAKAQTRTLATPAGY
jgi:hypothetical protein